MKNMLAYFNFKELYRTWQLLFLVITLGFIVASYYFEYSVVLNPCPLCLMQRVCVMLLAGLIGINFYFSISLKNKIILIMQLVVLIAGIFFAARQIWLQYFFVGDTTAACLPGFKMMLHYLPWTSITHALLWGGGDCAEVTWKWLGISMPGWTMLFFVVMLVFTSINYIFL